MRLPCVERWISALPDSLTALVFLALWIQPLAFGNDGVRNGMLIMLVEFILVHASGFLGGQIFAERISRSRRFLILAGFSVFYLIFVATFALSFDQWWPYIAFGWLMLGKFASVLARNLPSGERLKQLETEWGIGAVVYILGGLLHGDPADAGIRDYAGCDPESRSAGRRYVGRRTAARYRVRRALFQPDRLVQGETVGLITWLPEQRWRQLSC
jgi:hypothetical protein